MAEQQTVRACKRMQVLSLLRQCGGSEGDLEGRAGRCKGQGWAGNETRQFRLTLPLLLRARQNAQADSLFDLCAKASDTAFPSAGALCRTRKAWTKRGGAVRLHVRFELSARLREVELLPLRVRGREDAVDAQVPLDVRRLLLALRRLVERVLLAREAARDLRATPPAKDRHAQAARARQHARARAQSLARAHARARPHAGAHPRAHTRAHARAHAQAHARAHAQAHARAHARAHAHLHRSTDAETKDA
eukprot:3942765-Pleurochrysis_carterae.AAC.3